MFDKILDLFQSGSIPNKFTIFMGEQIRKARLEAKMSQAELAEKAHFRQAAISQIESGKREVSSSELIYLSFSLNKPISYFFPIKYLNLVVEGENSQLTILEQELLIQARRLNNEDLRKLIAQAKALADLSEQ